MRGRTAKPTERIKRLRAAIFLFLLTVPAEAAALPEPGNPRKITNLAGFDDLGQPVAAIFKWLIVFIPTVAALYLILSGYRYIVAQGNQDLTEKAKKSLLYAVYGFIVALISVALLVLVSNALGFNSGLVI